MKYAYIVYEFSYDLGTELKAVFPDGDDLDRRFKTWAFKFYFSLDYDGYKKRRVLTSEKDPRQEYIDEILNFTMGSVTVVSEGFIDNPCGGIYIAKVPSI